MRTADAQKGSYGVRGSFLCQGGSPMKCNLDVICFMHIHNGLQSRRNSVALPFGTTK